MLSHTFDDKICFQCLLTSHFSCIYRYFGGFLLFNLVIFLSYQCTEEAVNFGDIIVGSSASQELTIHNNSDCSLHYNLLIDQEISGPYDDEQSARDVLGKRPLPGRTSCGFLFIKKAKLGFHS